MSVLSDELRKVLFYDLNVVYLADDIDALEAELQKAEKRIAELESMVPRWMDSQKVGTNVWHVCKVDFTTSPPRCLVIPLPLPAPPTSAEQEKEPICIYDQLNDTICKGKFINGYGFPCSTCGHARR